MKSQDKGLLGKIRQVVVVKRGFKLWGNGKALGIPSLKAGEWYDRRSVRPWR